MAHLYARLGVSLVLTLALLAGSTHAQRDVTSTRGILQAADADGNGEVSAEEWAAFLAQVAGEEDGSVDRYRAKALVLELDIDGDGGVGMNDFDLAITGEDRDGDGLPDGRWLTIILGSISDVDDDGFLTDEEVEALRGDVVIVDGHIPFAIVEEWMKRAESLPPPADRNAMTAGVILVGFDALLDADANGTVTMADLRLIFTTADQNGDGIVDATELAPNAPGAGWASRWSISEEDRKRAPLMPWQRTLEDALLLVEETGKPLLVCVNVDGESASDNLAYGRYRDPAFLELAQGFVTVLASPDMREPRGHDDRGHRLPDRRFGRLINSEHIDIEPGLYERYFNGNRVAPRHVGVSPDGEVLFDLFLLQNLSAIDAKLEEHGVPTEPRPDPATLDDEALLRSPDSADRGELERRFAEGDVERKLGLLAHALSTERVVQHTELLRMALRDPEAQVRLAGVLGLTRSPAAMPLALVPEAWTVARDDADGRAGLLGALQAAAQDPDPERAKEAALLQRTFTDLAAVHELGSLDRWRLAFAVIPPVEEGPHDLDETGGLLEELERALDDGGDEAEVWIQLAEVRMRMANLMLASGGNPSFYFQDAVTACDEALRLAPGDGRALGFKAWASYMLSDTEAAGTFAASALPRLLREADRPLVREVANVLAQVRTREVYAAVRADEPLAAGALTEARAAHDLLTEHPASTEAQWRTYLELLGSVRAFGLQGEVVRRAVRRLPVSGDMHAWLRFQVLRDEGARALEAYYADEVLPRATDEDRATVAWFSGVASHFAAERDVENRETDTALETYARAVATLQESVDLERSFEASAGHYQCHALAGTARIHLEAERFREAVDALLRGVALAPESYEVADGLGNTPQATARALRVALRRAGEVELVEELEKGLQVFALSSRRGANRG